MMFRRKDLSEKHRALVGMRQLSVLTIVFCCIFIMPAHGATVDYRLFNGGTVSDSLIVADSIIVDIGRPNMLSTVFGPALPNRASAKQQVPDVYAAANNQFRFIWSDSLLTGSTTIEKIYRRDISILPKSIDTSANLIVVSPFDTLPVSYLHVAHNDNHFLVCVNQGGHDLTGFGDAGALKTGIVTSTMQGSTMCYYKNNTFITAYIKSSNVVAFRQIAFSGATLTLPAPEDTLAVDATGSISWIDPSIAADSNGNVCALWLRGNNSNIPKKVIYGLYDNTFTPIKIDSFPDNAAGPGKPNYYDNAPVVSYARNKFAAVSWDLTGILLRTFEIKTLPASVDTQSVRIKAAANCRYPAIATNGRTMVFSWMNYSVDKKNVKISCVRYPITGGAINVVSPSTEYTVSDTTFALGILDTAKDFMLRCTIDSTGNMAFCWNLHDFGHAAIVANKNLLRSSGAWVSPVDSLPSYQGDSVSFYKAAVTLNPASISAAAQDTLDSLYLSVDNGAHWTFFKNNTVNVQEVKGTYKNYQYKIILKNIDSLTTPAVKRVLFQWSAKPRLMPLDAVWKNSVLQPGKRFGDTLTCLSRSDTVTCRFGFVPVDSTDTLTTSSIRKGQTVIDNVNRFRGWLTIDTIVPLSKTDTIAWRFTATNKRGWVGTDSVFYVKTRNAVPRLGLQTSTNGGPWVATSGQSRINVQQTDSIDFTYTVQDSNDAGAMVRAYLNNAVVDSATQNSPGHYRFHCIGGLPQGDVLRFTAKDPDDSTVAIVNCGVNHFPRINSIVVKGVTARGGDTLRVGIGAATPIVVHGFDADIGYGDTIRYTLRRPTVSDSVQKDSVFTWFPLRSDSLMKIFVSDLAGKMDSLQFYIKFPWYEADAALNEGLIAAKKILSDSISLIIGSAACDTIPIPLKNTGNDTLSIVSVYYKGSAGKWLRMQVPQSASLVTFDSLNTATIAPIRCAPGSVVTLYALLYADSLKGDFYAYDTLIVGTDDAAHSLDSIPMRLKYNDLPRLFSMSYDFAFNKPYWLAKNTALKKAAYIFPAHAKISMTFSEPVDSASVAKAIKIYSLNDLHVDKNYPPIPLNFSWSSGKTKLDLSPTYSAVSPYFKFKPPPGFFIPTDKLELIVSSTIVDTAGPPNGPNSLDVHQIFKRSNALADTTLFLNVDSVKYAITAVSPDTGANGVDFKPPLAITFSSPPFPGTIDTNKVNNKTLVVSSRYFGSAQIAFDSIYVNGATAFFIPAKRFFYSDTVHCWYRSLWARDSLGYSIDLNGDGIPRAMFDSTAAEDDKRWTFFVKDIAASWVYPANAVTDAPCDTAITIMFSDSVNASVIDTSKIGNRSVQIFSRCNGGTPLAMASVKIFGKKVLFRPVHRLYYGDSIYCVYQGLSTLDSALYAVSAETSGAIFTKNRMQWSYKVKEINFASLVPDSSASSSSMHPEIILKFTQPVWSGLFDSDTSMRNRSIKVTSMYMKDSCLSFKNLAISPDSTLISITTRAVFFSNDSVHCTFRGFKKEYDYNNIDNIPKDSDGVVAARSWYFNIQNQEFFTYPNPYKPGADPRHCGPSGPCGIYFKNLHVLKRGIDEVIIKIFTMNALPLYSTQKAGVRIRYQVGNPNLIPEWKWDTRNQKGDFVASGLYFYAIYDPAGSLLFKGKLMIVR